MDGACLSCIAVWGQGTLPASCIKSHANDSLIVSAMILTTWDEIDWFIHSFIYSHSIDHTDVEFVIKYKYKQATIYKYKYNFR